MATKKKTAPEAPPFVQGIKGFDSNLKCRGYQFAIGETFKHEGRVKACSRGFHAVKGDAYPLSVFDYYGPAGNRFCRVELSGAIDSDDGVKVAAEILKVGQEISLRDLTLEAAKWVIDRATEAGDAAKSANGLISSNTGDYSAATNTGNRSAATNTGDYSAATNTGYQSAATNTGDRSVATNTGDYSAATNTGYQSAATNTGKHGVAMACGYEGRVMGADGVVLFAVERGPWNGQSYPTISAAHGIVGQDGIKADTWYLARGGKLVEA